MIRRTPILALLLIAGACSGSHDGADAAADGATADAGAGLDAGSTRPDAGRDAGLPDAGLARDADLGLDAPADSAVDAAGDAGPCGPSSCAGRVCGRSACGYPCGECFRDQHCTAGGACANGPPAREPCFDAFGLAVPEGGVGQRRCLTDETQQQRCMCAGGAADAWVDCQECETLVIEGPRGARCVTDAQCGAGLPCSPGLRLCGEDCAAGSTTCPADTACAFDETLGGACLPVCAACGTATCGESGRCVDAELAFVCVPASYSWRPCGF